MTVEVTCPRCARVSVFQEITKSADEFCPDGCDFPLFWATAAGAQGVDETGDAFRRMPGAEGRGTVGDRECPHCGERNTLTRELCIRCSGVLVTPRAEPPPPQPWPAPPELPPELPDPRRWPLYAAIGVLVLLVLLLAGEIWIW